MRLISIFLHFYTTNFSSLDRYTIYCHSAELSPFQWTDEPFGPLPPLLALFPLPLLLLLERSSRSSSLLAGNLLDFSSRLFDELPGGELFSEFPSLLAFFSCAAVMTRKKSCYFIFPLCIINVLLDILCHLLQIRKPYLFNRHSPIPQTTITRAGAISLDDDDNDQLIY